MQIVSWNVAGIRACIKKGFIDFFNEINADIFCVQEVKALKEQIEFLPEGYELYAYPAVRKGYSGTLIYTKMKPLSVKYGIGDSEYDDEGRNITLEFADFYLVNCYVPNVKRTLERMASRMRYEELFLNYIEELKQTKPVIFCGDLNVAHEEIDIKNAKANIGNAGFTYEERDKLTNLLAHGFTDTFRYFYPDKTDAYTWWSYMKDVRAKNIGWRIDYFIVSNDVLPYLKDSIIYKDIYGSDHCPIGLILKDK